MKNSSAFRLVHASDRMARFLFGAALVLSLMLSLRPALAQEAAGAGIIVVDMQRIQRDAAAAVSVREQSAALRANLEKTIAERAREISEEEAELAELRERASASEFKARVRSFEEKVFANRAFAQRESAKLQAMQADAFKRVRGEILRIIAALMRERGAEITLDSSQIVLGVDTLNVTAEVIERLNAELPTLALTVPSPPE